MNVLFVANNGNRHGASRALHHLVANLDRSRCASMVLFHQGGPIVTEYGPLCRTAVARYPDMSWLPHRPRRAVLAQRARSELRACLESFRPDILYINTIGKNPIAEAAMAVEGIPKVVHCHEMDATFLGVGEPWIRRLAERCSVFVACSDAVADFLARCVGIEPERVRTMREAVDTPGLAAWTPEEAVNPRRTLGIPEDALWIGGAGNAIHRKGVDLFVAAAGELARRHPDRDLRFAWIGGDDRVHASHYMESVRALASRLDLEGRFRWIREVDDPVPLVAALDVFVLPSREDPQPLVMLEAMALGKPIVGSAVGGIPEALAEDCGVLVDRVGVEGFVSALERVIQDVSLRRRLGANARERAVREFDAASRAEAYHTLFDELTAARAARPHHSEALA